MILQKFISESIFLKTSKALKELFDKDLYLFENGVSERAISHKFAGYLQKEFGKDLHVDCEYNRHFEYPKRLLEIKNHVVKQRRASEKLSDHEENYGICVSPDIVVHERGNDNNNILVLEIKRGDNSSVSDEKYDLLKLKTYIKEFKYQFGVFIKFKMSKDLGVQKICFLKKNYENNHELQDISIKFKRYLEVKLKTKIPE